MPRIHALAALSLALICAVPASAQSVTGPVVPSAPFPVVGGAFLPHETPPPRCLCVRAPCYCAGYDWGDLRHPAPPIAPPGFPPRRPPVWPPAPR